MDKFCAIKEFVSKRPFSMGVYGYGSAIFKQATFDDKALIDLIFIVDDLSLWHKENIIVNPGDYSFIGKLHLSRKCVSKIKGFNNITYVSNIKENGFAFKYGVVEVEDYLNSLNRWESFFLAGRFHKPVLEVWGSEEINEAIEYNRFCALMIGCLFCDEFSNVVELYENICRLSYIGDVRMLFAENPNKVSNIVKGSLSQFVNLYLGNYDFIEFFYDGTIRVKHSILLERVVELPVCLLDSLISCNTNFKSLYSIRKNILRFLKGRNKEESFHQIVEGVKTNGIVKSVPYVLRKINKKISGS